MVVTLSFLEFSQFNCPSALFRYDTNGRLPLHVAAACGKADVLEWLISVVCSKESKNAKKLSIDALDKESGWTALHRAVYYGRIPCVILLVKVCRLFLHAIYFPVHYARLYIFTKELLLLVMQVSCSLIRDY